MTILQLLVYFRLRMQQSDHMHLGTSNGYLILGYGISLLLS